MQPIRELSEATGLGHSTIAKMCQEHLIECEKRGNAWYALLIEVERAMIEYDIEPRNR
jgi:hypothetical protein